MVRSRSAWCWVGVVGLHTGLALGASPGEPVVTVASVVETPPLYDDKAGGKSNADDPAIWVHPTHPEATLVLGTKKNGGLSVYDLAGLELQSLAPPAAPSKDDEPGRFNNVDILRGFALAGRRVDLAVVTDRGRDQIRFYAIDPRAAELRTPPLADVTAPDVPFVFSYDQLEVNQQATAYGIAARSGSRGRPAQVFASRRHRTDVAQLSVIATPDGRVTYERAGTITVPHVFATRRGGTWSPCASSDDELPQVEGMVVDEDLGTLFMAQEDVGIWELSLDRRRGEPHLIDRVREFGVPFDRIYDAAEDEYVCTVRFDRDPGVGGKHLSADAEGLTIYDAPDGRGYLLASSQGDSTYAVYERGGGHRFVGSFRVGATPTIDGAEHSDGAAVINVPLGPKFPHGLFVTQDGENSPVALDGGGEPRVGTNFKYVPWEDIASAFPRPLLVDEHGARRDDSCR